MSVQTSLTIVATCLTVAATGCGDTTSETDDEPTNFGGQGGVTTADRKEARRISKSLCQESGLKAVAREYGGDATDEFSVAQAYADQTYIARLRQDAWEGCLAGFKGGSAPAQPKFEVNTPGRGQAIVYVDSEAEADRICDAAQAGEYPELDGVSQLIEKLPTSTPGANTDGPNCMLP